MSFNFSGASTFGVERRQNMPLDSAFFYLRHLELKLRSVNLYTLCNCIKTIDLALSGIHRNSDLMCSLSADAWLEMRDRLFLHLLCNFSGRVSLITEDSTNPVNSSNSCSITGSIEFCPKKESRPKEAYRQSLDRLEPSVFLTVERVLKSGRQYIMPVDFQASPNDESIEAISLLHRFYEICEGEAERAKLSAHDLWHHLRAEGRSSADPHRRRKILKKMIRLQKLWGVPVTDH